MIPQIVQVYRTQSAKDLSFCMLLNFLICSTSWVFYGLLTDARTVWMTNAISTVFITILIVLKIRYTPKGDR